MTYEQIESQYPFEFEARMKNKLTYRYPQGESYKDVIKRLEPVIFELERAKRPILVIAHQAVLRCLYGYFMDEPLEKIPYLSINLHTIYKLSPTDYSTEVDRYTFGCGKSKIQTSHKVIGSNFHLGGNTPIKTTPTFSDSLTIPTKAAERQGRKVSRDFLEERKKDGGSVCGDVEIANERSPRLSPNASGSSAPAMTNGQLLGHSHGHHAQSAKSDDCDLI